MIFWHFCCVDCTVFRHLWASVHMNSLYRFKRPYSEGVMLLKTISGGYFVDEETGDSIYLPAKTSIRTEEEREQIKQAIAKKEEQEAARRVANSFTYGLCG